MRVWSAVREILWPARCVGCAAFGLFLCEGCAGRLDAERVDLAERCPVCASSMSGPGPNCPRCTWWDPALDGCLATFEMRGIARRLVHQYKYGPCPEVAPMLATRMARLWSPATFDCAVAVPLHPRRERERGFNQASRLLNELEWPRLDGALVRHRYTRRQVGRGEDARRRGVAGAFRYSGPSLEGQRIALVDDVVTTGATARECALVLKDAGARSVTVVAFARASYAPRPSAEAIAEDEPD